MGGHCTTCGHRKHLFRDCCVELMVRRNTKCDSCDNTVAHCGKQRQFYINVTQTQGKIADEKIPIYEWRDVIIATPQSNYQVITIDRPVAQTRAEYRTERRPVTKQRTIYYDEPYNVFERDYYSRDNGRWVQKYRRESKYESYTDYEYVQVRHDVRETVMRPTTETRYTMTPPLVGQSEPKYEKRRIIVGWHDNEARPISKRVILSRKVAKTCYHCTCAKCVPTVICDCRSWIAHIFIRGPRCNGELYESPLEV
jgi:hypothetical protein